MSAPSSARHELRALLALAVPVILAQLGMMGLGTIDTVMVGHAFPESLASLALGNTWHFSTLILGMGAAAGFDPLLSQAWGAGDDDAYDRAFVRGVGVCLLLSAPIMLSQLFTGEVLALAREPAEALPVAVAWTRAVMPSVPAVLVYGLVRQALQSRGAARPALWVVGIGNAVNVLGNTLFMHGFGPVPALGPAGSGWSTTLVRWVMLFALLAFADRERAALRRAWRELTDLRMLSDMVARTLPVGFQWGTEMWSFHVGFLISGWFGPVATAGHAIAGMLCGISFMVPVGISAAASARVGNLIGAGEDWQTAARVAVRLGSAWGLCAAALFWLAPGFLVDQVVSDAPDIRALAITLLPFAAAFQVFDATQGVLFGVLRGANDTSVPTAANLVGYWVIGVPVGAWLALYGGLEVRGVWVGYCVGLAMVTALLLWRLEQVIARGVTRADVAAAEA